MTDADVLVLIQRAKDEIRTAYQLTDGPTRANVLRAWRILDRLERTIERVDG